ncbi:hypothetical protein HBI88_190700 [Parastagonospora nodorum]|nr:hypothetical protein HBI97_208520 [Parastagonospora nodorum]KAH5814306.1 hypothetical protein HBI96_071000 [Parastagonospora nodorum]KAH5828441.1 hypothetical protein HBI94_055420 [Parastagonospora nodorum]KAH5838442.1 hypothetical protein HBI93_070770 [Parastagonospora nodorum]KAH5854835.1 hypothetical protein HBI90_186020 [Parastagonospora nodorum]
MVDWRYMLLPLAAVHELMQPQPWTSSELNLRRARTDASTHTFDRISSTTNAVVSLKKFHVWEMSLAALVAKVAVLEPEILEEISGARQFGKHPSIIKINLALKRFKTRFESDDLPTSGDIHGFLDSIENVPDLDVLSSQHFSDLYFSECFHKALDSTLYVIIARLQERSSHADLLRTINESSDGKSLAVKAVERTLVRSLGLLLLCSATLGHDQTPWTVFQNLESSTLGGRPFMRKRFTKYQKRLRNLLDLSILQHMPPEEYFTYDIRHGKGRSRPYNVRREEPVSSLTEITQSWDITKSPEGLTWIHVPSTNGLTVKALIVAVRDDFVDSFTMRFHLSHVAPGDPLLTYREVQYWSDATDGIALNVIVFPCLALTTIGQHIARRGEYKVLRDMLTTATSGAYSSDCTVHLDRTLDEAYFPGLSASDLAVRNADQIVSGKYSTSESWPKDNVPIVIVPQLWLWRIGNVIVSAHNTTQQSGNLRHIVWRDKGSGPARYAPIVDQMDADLQMRLIMTDFIYAFGQETTLNDGSKVPPTLDLFESRVVSLLSEVKTYIRDTKRNAIDYDTEERFYHVLSDCRSELAMLQHVLEQQDEILNSLLEDCCHPQPFASNQPNSTSMTPSQTPASGSPLSHIEPVPDWTPVRKGQVILERYQKRIRKIDGDAERIEKNVQDLLNLKRTYASVQDSHASVLLSIAAIGFAVVTIIFAPLAFLTALFALDMQGFDRLRVHVTSENEPGGLSGAGGKQDLAANVVTNKDAVYDSRKMAGVFISTEILTILVTCLLVWASLRWFGIEFGDFRIGQDAKHQSESSTAQGSDTALDKNTVKGSRDQRKGGSFWKRTESRGSDKHADLA